MAGCVCSAPAVPKWCLNMGKFPIADAELSKIWVCRRCKARNKAGSKVCRKCGYSALRPKRKNARVKK